jgi:non-ribosomal peptide synthetase component F
MLAVLKAGGTFVPLDPTSPSSRLQNLVRAVEASVLLCARSHVANLTEIAQTVLPVDEDTILPFPTALENGNSDCYRAKPENAAYILFTSGSTGEPKVIPNSSSELGCRH